MYGYFALLLINGIVMGKSREFAFPNDEEVELKKLRLLKRRLNLGSVVELVVLSSLCINQNAVVVGKRFNKERVTRRIVYRSCA